MTLPDRVPGFFSSAAAAALDAIGLIRGWRFFDHAGETVLKLSTPNFVANSHVRTQHILAVQHTACSITSTAPACLIP